VFAQLTKDFLGNPPGKRIDVSDEHGKVLIQQGIAEAIQDDPIGPLVAKTMEQAMGRLSDGINAAVNAALKQFADAQSKSRKNGNPILFGENGEGDHKKNFGDFCLALARDDRKYLEKHYGATISVTRNAGGAVKFVDVPTMVSKFLQPDPARDTIPLHQRGMLQDNTRAHGQKSRGERRRMCESWPAPGDREEFFAWGEFRM
jgi:hypothetical protein